MIKKKTIVALVVLVFGMLPVAKVWAAAYVTLNAFSGQATTIQVSGGGWNSGEGVNIYLGSASGSPAASATAGTDSFFGPIPLNIPANTPQGALPIIAVGSSGQTETNSYYVVPFSPSITPASSPNTPGSSVAVTGQGYAPGETVNFIISGASVGQVITDSSGAFANGSFVVPNIATGTYILHGTGASSGADAIFYFYIGGFFPSASPSVYYLLPGGSLSFSGSGFKAGEIVTVTQGNNPSVLSTITADASGGFNGAGSFVVPLSLAGGVRTFHLKGNAGNAAPDVMVTVGTFNGTISPSSYYVSPGDALTFSGSGFAPTETVNVFIDSSATPASSFKADSSGNFTAAGSITIPFAFAGSTHTFMLRGLNSGAGASVDITVGGFFPNIIPSTYYVTPGQKFYINGSGFAAGEVVKVTLGSQNISTTTSASGGFAQAGPFVAPYSGGPLNITATGQSSGVTATTQATLGGLYPSVSPSAWYVLPGSAISFSGSGFAPGETVNIARGKTAVGNTVADSSGNFANASSTVPFVSGAQTYTFTGSSSGASTVVSLTVAAITPYADADTYYTTPGGTVNVAGHNFAAGENVTAIIGSVTVNSTADNLGNTPSIPVTIPLNAQSPAVITLTGVSSGASASVPITLAPFAPQITPSSWYVGPGATVTFSGTGFAPGETVAVSLNNSAASSAVVSASGTITNLAVQIPFSATSAKFVFNGNITQSNTTVNIGVAQLAPSIWLSTYYDQGGNPITVFGGGFAGGEKIDVSFNGTALGTVTADAGGNFSLPSTIPFGPAGNKTIQARGESSGAVATAQFTQPQVYTNAQLGSYAGAPGSAVTFIGSGYLPNEPVQITTDRTGSSPVYTFDANATGNFNDSGYSIPNTFTGGPLTLTIIGTHSFTSTSITYYVTGP